MNEMVKDAVVWIKTRSGLIKDTVEQFPGDSK